MPRANLDILMKRLGTDLLLRYPGPSGYWEGGDLATRSRRQGRERDLELAGGLDAADQMLINRLKTHRGELAGLGHPEYGSRHHELIGEPNVERTRFQIKRYILEALSHEPRIAKILSCNVLPGHQPPRDLVRVVIDVLLIEEDTPRNLVIPFSLEPPE